MRYDLPESRTPSRFRLILPTAVLFVILAGMLFGSVYALAFAINAVCEVIEGII